MPMYTIRGTYEQIGTFTWTVKARSAKAAYKKWVDEGQEWDANPMDAHVVADVVEDGRGKAVDVVDFEE